MPKKPTLVDQLVDGVVRDIFRGVHAVGTSLPPMRKLATAHGVTLPTAQRAVAKLEELGLVEVRQGRGVRVLDPDRHAGLDALPYWLDAILEDTEASVTMLAEFLELRRVLAKSFLGRIPADADFARVEDAIERFAAATPEQDRPGSLEDLEVIRELMALAPQRAFGLVFNVLEKLLAAVPQVQVAMYSEASANLMAYRMLVGLLKEPDRDLEPVYAALEYLDQLTLDRFRNILESS